MTNQNQQKQILAVLTATMIALISAIGTVSAHTPTTLPYGALNHQEDESYFWHDGVLYVNSIPSQGNGLFLAENDIDADYSIDQAIQRFHIDEDIQAFIVQPSEFSNVVIMYELDDNLQFQITHIYEDNESGLNQEVLQ